MKKLMFLTALFALSFQGFSQTEIISAKLKKDKIPGEIIMAIERDFPGESVTEYVGLPVKLVEEEWYVNINEDAENQIFDSYMVNISGKDQSFHAAYDKDGKLLFTREKLKNHALPQIVERAIAKEFPGWVATEDKIVMTHFLQNNKKKVRYVVKLSKDGKHEQVVFDANGNLIKGGKHAMKKSVSPKMHKDEVHARDDSKKK